VREANRIAVVSKGRIVEFGSHDGLLANHHDGLYASMVKGEVRRKHSHRQSPNPEIMMMTIFSRKWTSKFYCLFSILLLIIIGIFPVQLSIGPDMFVFYLIG
jgi:ABC-type microcin C transport system duplicated ATPase subunit YejF